MRIANPIYDAAFKYLMEDTEIAKGLIGRIIGEQIEELVMQPQELHLQSDKYLVIILRIDFKATIKTKDEQYKKVLIEIQKGKVDTDVLRFRRYLGTNYRKQDEVKLDDGSVEKLSLPIIPIYFLGFRLEKIKTPVMKSNCCYKDLVTEQELLEKEDFVEQLTHEGYFIQIPRLHRRHRNELERVLKVFNQSYAISDDKRLMEISEKEFQKDSLLKQIVDRLLRAAADEELLAKMEMEEEVEEMIEKHLRENQELKGENQELKGELQKALDNVILQFILHTEFSDEKIAALQKVSIDRVQKLRQAVEMDNKSN